MAKLSLNDLRSSGAFFDDLARQISNCVKSRKEGGKISWVNVLTPGANANVNANNGSDGVVATDPNEHLDLILPKDGRDEVLQSNSKVRTMNDAMINEYMYKS